MSKVERNLRQRRVDILPIRQRFLIVCEGEKTEPNYFERFRVPSIVVEIEGTGFNTYSLVKKAMELRDKKGFTGEDDQVWCVFDRDDSTRAQFNRAISYARENGLHVAYSNEAFELWYLLHFNYVDTGITREQYIDKLRPLFGRKYEKNSPGMFDALFAKMQTAIKHAKKLHKSMQGISPADANPSTTVHLLVEALRKSELR